MAHYLALMTSPSGNDVTSHVTRDQVDTGTKTRPIERGDETRFSTSTADVNSCREVDQLPMGSDAAGHVNRLTTTLL